MSGLASSEDELFADGAARDLAITFSSVSKSYLRDARRSLLRKNLIRWFRHRAKKRFYALRNVSFVLEGGKSLAIVGPNGAGKSTVLQLISGISTPDSGNVSVRGKVAALIELGAGFHPDLTGAENVYLNASLLGFDRKQASDQFSEIVDFSGIGDFIDEPLRTYSSGMVLRLAFSVAIRTKPDILIIDEILAVGDQQFQRKCMGEIRRLRSDGTTLVFVAHATGLLYELCEEAIWLDHGQIREIGPAAIVLNKYDSSAG